MPAKLWLSSHRPSGRCVASNRPVGLSGLFGTAKLLRADSGLWSAKVVRAAGSRGLELLDRVRLQAHVRAAIEQIPEQAWQTLAD
jgi:hypothetical protein